MGANIFIYLIPTSILVVLYPYYFYGMVCWLENEVEEDIHIIYNDNEYTL